MDAAEANKFIDVILGDDERELLVDYGRIGTGCVESRYLRLLNPRSSTVAFQVRRDPQSHPLGDVFKLCPPYGEIARAGSVKITVKYRPRFPHVRDIDYFSILHGDTGCTHLQLQGVSLAPALVVSRHVLDFGVPSPKNDCTRSFVLINEREVHADFSFPFSSAQFSVCPPGGRVMPGARVRVTVRHWSDRRRPSRRILPLLVHNGAAHQVQLLAGAEAFDQPLPPLNLFHISPTSPACGPLVLDVDRVDFGSASTEDGGVQVIHASNVASRAVRVEWIADRADIFSVRPTTALVRPASTAMFEVIFMPDIPEYIYSGHVEALVTLDADGSGAADPALAADFTVAVPALGHTFPTGAETWVPRVRLAPSPLVMPPCSVNGSASATFTIHNLDKAKPVVYDLTSLDGGLLVRPVAGCVPPGALHVLTVQQAAGAAETAVQQQQLLWRLNLLAAHAAPLQLLLSQERPRVAWTPARLELPPACGGMVTRQPVTVRNLTRCRLRLQAQCHDAALWTAGGDLTLAPNQRRCVTWMCRAELCGGLTEYVVPHRLQLLDVADRPMGEESVQNLHVLARVVDVAVSCQPPCVDLGEQPLATPASGGVVLTNECASALTVVLALRPRPAPRLPSGIACILFSADDEDAFLERAVRRLTVPARDSVAVTLLLRAEVPGRYHYDLTYRLLADEDGGRAVAEPCALTELTMTAEHQRVRVADVEAACGDRFLDKLLMWKLLGVDRLNEALRKPGESAQSLLMVIAPRPVTAPALRAALVLQNPCSFRVAWLLERGLEADGSRAQLPDWFQFTPTNGILDPLACETLSLTVGPLAAPGLACARLRLCVRGGQRVPLTVVSTAVPTGASWVFTASEPPCPGLLLPAEGADRPAALHSALGRDAPQRLTLQPVTISCRVPPVQFCPLFNGGLQPVQYHVHTEYLDDLAQENFGVPVIRCLDTDGTVPAGGCTRIRLVFQPLEVRRYTALLPVCVSAPCCQHPLLLVADGLPPGVPAALAMPRVPARQMAVLPGQHVRLSHRYLQYDALCIHTEQTRLIYMHNCSTDVLRFAWTQRLTGDQCCTVFGSGHHGDHLGNLGPSVQPEPSEGVLRPGEVAPVRLTISAGEVAQIYTHTVYLAFRNLTREHLYTLNRAAWQAECERRQAAFLIDERHPEGVCPPPPPPPQEPAIIYKTVTLVAWIQHVDDTPMADDPGWRERTFVPLMTSAPNPCVDDDAASGGGAAVEDVQCVQQLLTTLLRQLLRDCELQTTLKRLRKQAVPYFSQLVAAPRGDAVRQFRRPRRAEQPRLVERALHGLIFSVVREVAGAEAGLAEAPPLDGSLSHSEHGTETSSRVGTAASDATETLVDGAGDASEQECTPESSMYEMQT